MTHTLRDVDPPRTDPCDRHPSVQWPVLMAYIAVPVVLGTLIGLVIDTGPWYDQLEKSPLNPPNAVFGPVWTVLYVLTGVAAYLAWSAPGTVHLRSAMTLWTAQLLLNLAWSPIFFGAESPTAALVEIIVLFVLVVATIAVFARRSVAAAVLLVPYAAWIAFAGYLNAYIVAKN
jgi:tryptophan-rich sensory protein